MHTMYTTIGEKNMEKNHMIRLKTEVYHKLCIKREQMKQKYNTNYTLSEIIEICLLAEDLYEERNN